MAVANCDNLWPLGVTQKVCEKSDEKACSITKIRSQPAFDFRDSHALSPSVVFDLVAGEAIDGSTTRVSASPDADYRYPHGEAAPC